jgi:esterase
MTPPTPTDKFVKADGLRIHYLDWGDPSRPAIVMLHGLRSFAHAWDPVARRFADTYRILAVDQRGRGDSDWSRTADYHPNAYVSDLEHLVDEVGLKSFILMGHSMGGSNTVIYASRHPDRVKAAIVVDFGPAGNVPPPGRARLARELQHTPPEFPSWEAARAFWHSERPNISEEALNIRLFNTLKELPDGRVGWKYDIQGIKKARENPPQAEQEDMWKHVRNITCPTLVLRGALSDILSRETATEMAAANRNIRWVEVPAASHYVYEDNLSFFNTEVAKFLHGLK